GRSAGGAGGHLAGNFREAAAALDRRGKDALSETADHKQRGLPALPPGPLLVEQEEPRSLAERFAVLPTGSGQRPWLRAGVRWDRGFLHLPGLLWLRRAASARGHAQGQGSSFKSARTGSDT